MFQYLQKIGKSLMVPVAVLPVAAILLGIGYKIDPVGWGTNSQLAALLIKSGSSIINNMPMLFAVGIAFGISKDKSGSAALTGLVAFLVITTILSIDSVSQIKAIDVKDVPVAFSHINNQFIGIICGLISGELYNKFSDTKLPKFLDFFSGKIFVPILTSVVMLIVSFVLLYIWPLIYNSLVNFGISIVGMGSLGAGLYGFFNRILIPIGLHHALNSIFWFNVAGINDIGRFLGNTTEAYANLPETLKGVYNVGMYQGGFFPIMMFGLVGAATAFVYTTKDKNKNRIMSIMIATSFASFFTGVTEPLEFAFMFTAPVLYLIHALLTGLSLYIAASFNWIAGFGFSAGFIDLWLSSSNPNSHNWYMLIFLGLIFFVVYFIVFSSIIRIFNLKTPGREDDIDDEFLAK